MKELQYLRFCYGIDKVYPLMDDSDWQQIYDFCMKQSLVGIGFAGCEKVPDNNRPSKELILNWYAQTRQIEGRNQLMNDRCQELQTMFAEAGFATCILKGQGNALMYPNPLRRQSGDIDIWINPKANVRKIILFLGTKCDIKRQIIGYHHVKFPIWDDVEVEVHWRPSWRSSPVHNHRLQRWFKEQAGDTCEKGGLIVPTWEFNVVYQLQHMFLHVLQEGLGLRQVMDYYFVLKARNTDSGNQGNTELGKTLRYLGLWKFAEAMMYVMKEVFALDEAYMIAPVNEKSGRFLLEEILHSGNFGRLDERNTGLHQQHGLKRSLYQLKRSWRFIQSYPSEVICYPLRFYHVIWRKCQLWRWE